MHTSDVLPAPSADTPRLPFPHCLHCHLTDRRLTDCSMTSLDAASPTSVSRLSFPVKTLRSPEAENAPGSTPSSSRSSISSLTRLTNQLSTYGLASPSTPTNLSAEPTAPDIIYTPPPAFQLSSQRRPVPTADTRRYGVVCPTPERPDRVAPPVLAEVPVSEEAKRRISSDLRKEIELSLLHWKTDGGSETGSRNSCTLPKSNRRELKPPERWVCGT